MGPGGGPYISNDMGPPGPMSLGKWGPGGGGGGGGVDIARFKMKGLLFF